jgi:hypothetical protein
VIHTRVKEVQFDSDGSAHGGTAFVGIPACRFVGAYFQFDPDDLTADVTLTSLGQDFDTADGIAHNHLISRLSPVEELVDSPLEVVFHNVSGAGKATVTLFLSYGR